MSKKIIIDLHIHSSDSNLSGSNISKFTDLQMLEKLHKNYVKVACFADHYELFVDNFYKRVDLIANHKVIDIVLLPGCEIDLASLSKQSKGQAVIVFDPNQDLYAIAKIVKDNFSRANNKWLTYKQACELFNNFEYMIFPHSGKGQDNMVAEDLLDSNVHGLDSTSLKSPNLKKIRKVIQAPIVCFSDTHDWKKYPFDNTKYQTWVEAEPTFKSIKEALMNNKTGITGV
ncbi:hypothetical protein [Mycoplasma simbae]|uniref:hypothetical protein n=1 Tax=Mycoplasma simbae TaxID=36744 RepID=UPI00049829C8|nr:hypothetical protein [Mycoplasma simbae]